MSTATPSIEVVQLTPELAKEFLDKNTNNYRRPGTRAVIELANAMSRGEFNSIIPSNDAISFAEDGTMTNGQHRCMAVIRSGVTIPVLVLRGGGTELGDVMDVGRKRSTAQVLERHGFKDGTFLASTVRRYGYIVTGDEGNRMFTNPQILAFVEKNHDTLLVPAMKYARRKGKPVGLVKAVVSGVYVAAAQADVELAEEFFDRLTDGTGLYDGHPVHALRKRFAEPGGKKMFSGGRGDMVFQSALTIKAWNAFYQRQEVRALRWRGKGKLATEEFPEIASPRPLQQV